MALPFFDVRRPKVGAALPKAQQTPSGGLPDAGLWGPGSG
jgi:hypothetical protein